MGRHPLARVVHNQLIATFCCGLPPITVGTGAWYNWLDAPDTRSFTYQTPLGRLTVRREVRHGCWYWYAYHTRYGKLRKTYLGKSEELSLQRLDDALSKLGESSLQKVRELPTQSQELPARSEISDLEQKESIQSKKSLLASQLVLLKSKLIPPPMPEYLVTRSRLFHLLQAGSMLPVTLVCAPAGSGKTTLVHEWVAHSGRVWAWISLDCGENDPLYFLVYLCEALQSVQPGLGDRLLAKHPATSRQRFSEAIVILLNELATLPTEMTLILDNYHVIKNKLIHNALALLFEHLPPHIHVLITSRGELPCSLARLRASGRICELDADALRFTCEEMEIFLLEKMQLKLRSAELTLLEQRTEGWIAGLCLASFAMQGQRDLAQCVATFSGTNRSIQTYFLEEVLAPQPEQVQFFLLATSLLDYLHDTLCHAVTGLADAACMLQQLERANLFLFPCAEPAGWYRYHPLLTEALRHHLEHTQPEQVAVLHTRASQWFEEQGQLEKAIEHALLAHDNAHAIALIEQVAPDLLARGEVIILHHWLDALPETAVHASTRLCIIKIWLVFITSQPDVFLNWVEIAEQALHAQQGQLSPLTRDELHAELVGLHAIYSVSFGNFSGALASCHQALQQLPPGNLYPRALLLMMLGFAYVRSIDVSEGAQAASQANSIFQVTGHALLSPYVVLSQAEIYLAQGRPVQAAKLCRQVLALAVEQNIPAIFATGIAHASLGQIYWEWNNLEMAKSHLLQAWDLGTQTQTSNTLFTAAWFLAQVSQVQGEAQERDHWIRQIEILAQQTGQVKAFEPLAAIRALLFLADGHVEDALLLMHKRCSELEDPANTSNGFEKYTQVRILIAAGRTSTDESYVWRALALLTRLYTAAKEAGNVRSQLEILVLQALALQLTGQHADALTALGRAVILAEPGRYVRIFVNEGEPVAKLLRQLLEQQRSQKAPGQALSLTYLANILKAFAPSVLPVSSITGEPVLNPLSWREHEVLRLLAAGRKNREIASELVVVTGTVKAHINTIYQKLGVSNRIQAVVRARSLGLL